MFKKKTKIEQLQEQMNKKRQVQKEEVKAFLTACFEKNRFECTKKLGVLEYLKVTDIEYYRALAYNLSGFTQEAIEHFGLVEEKSIYYKQSIEMLSLLYQNEGRYDDLDVLFSTNVLKTSPGDELLYRLKCLLSADNEWVYNNANKIRTGSIKRVPNIRNASTENSFFELCLLFAQMLVAAGGMLNQVSQYLYLQNTDNVSDIETDGNVKKIIQCYKKLCVLLSLSEFVEAIQFEGNTKTLAECALVNVQWNNKIKNFMSFEYQKHIVQIIVDMLNPKLHSNIEAKRCVLHILTLCASIRPEVRVEIINYYFDILKEAYLKGDIEAMLHIHYMYAEIKMCGKDWYHMQEKLDSFVKITPDVENLCGDVFLSKKLPRNIYDSYLNAEYTFGILSKDATGIKDYSALSLQYYRILEMVYSAKILVPLAKAIDIKELKNKANVCNDDDRKQKWLFDISCLQEIKDGKKTSVEIGKIRTLLSHTISSKFKNDDCAVEIRNQLMQLLSEEGKDALRNRQMLDVIGKNPTEQYRIPGAHIGYLPYSVACEAREYVISNLPIVISWFEK